MIYRVFKSTVGWSDVIFLFSENITFKEIKLNSKSSYLKKEDFIGKLNFDDKFINIINGGHINNKPYYFIYDMTINS